MNLAARRALAAALLAAAVTAAATACTPPQIPSQPAPTTFGADPQPNNPPDISCPPGQRWVYASSGWWCAR